MRRRLLTELQIALEVAGSYYRLVTQQQAVALADRGLARAQDLLDASRAKLAVGRVSQLDVLRAEQLVAQSQVQALDARTAIDDAKDQLRILMNRGPEFDFEVEAEFVPPVDERVDPERAVADALAHRLELQVAESALADAERSLGQARDALRPQLDFGLAVTRRATADTLRASFGTDDFQTTTVAAFSLPFDRTAESVAAANASIEIGRRRRDRDALRSRIAQEARRAVRQLSRLRQELALVDASVDFAQREAELATLRFQRGLSNNLDVVTAEGGLLAAQGRRLATLAALALARFELGATTGTLDPRRDVR